MIAGEFNSSPASTTDFGPWYNGEGFSGVTGISYWYVFAVLPTSSGEDYDVRLCVNEPGNDPQQGFGSYVAYSSTPVGEMSYVVLDRNDVASGTYWASVLNLSGATADKVVEFAADKGTISTSGTFGPYTMEAGDLVELHELLLPASTQTRIQIEVLSGSADFGISLHGGGSGYYTKANTVAGGTADAAGPGEDEWIFVEDHEIRFSEESAPDFVVNAEQALPGLRRLVELLRGVQSLVGRDPSDGVLRRNEADFLDEAADLLASIRRRSKRQLGRLNGET